MWKACAQNKTTYKKRLSHQPYGRRPTKPARLNTLFVVAQATGASGSMRDCSRNSRGGVQGSSRSFIVLKVLRNCKVSVGSILGNCRVSIGWPGMD